MVQLLQVQPSSLNRPNALMAAAGAKWLPLVAEAGFATRLMVLEAEFGALRSDCLVAGRTHPGMAHHTPSNVEPACTWDPFGPLPCCAALLLQLATAAWRLIPAMKPRHLVETHAGV